MIGADSIGELIERYTKHGWILRRVLLTAALAKNVGDEKTRLFGDAVIKHSDIDGAWFSRPPKPGGVAWEIRYLGDTPYALVERLDENALEFEEQLTVIESRLRDAVTKKQSA